MIPENGKNQYQDEVLAEAKKLTEGTEIPKDGMFSLEEILAEYGEIHSQKPRADAERETAEKQAARLPETTSPRPMSAAERVAIPAAKQQPSEAEAVQTSPKVAGPEPNASEERDGGPAAPAVPVQSENVPPSPRPIPMEDVVGRTVSAVMEEEQELLPEKKHRRGLFSKQRLDTEELYEQPEKTESRQEEESAEPKPIGPEEPLDEMAAKCRGEFRYQRKPLTAAIWLTGLLVGLMVWNERGAAIPFWTDIPLVQTVVLLAALLLACILCRSVFAYGFRMLGRRRCTGELLISLSALVCAADCASRPFLPERSAAMPYTAVVCAALTFALWGRVRESRGRFDTYRAAAMSEHPPYLVTDTPQGACKQTGCVTGFYTGTEQDSSPLRWQAALLPVVLMGTLVFAGLSSIGQGQKQDFLLCWSAILTAAASFALPLAWGLPYSRLAHQLQNDGCAVAGWAGAETISRKKTMILTDTDLFPPGTVRLNGVKVFAEELSHVASYAASLTRSAGCGLQRLFDDLVRSEGGTYYEPDDFSFYEEGGYSGMIKGERVLLGTASFMRKMEVRLPGDLHLHTGVFLAIDGHLAAVFAVKYCVAESVDWALTMLRHNHIIPILASRDANITPVLLKRKFSKGGKVQYPPLAARVALSEQQTGQGGWPRALLLREGLLPYAETVAGSRRLCSAARQCTAISLLGSVAGTLLSFYLTFQGSFSLMTPMTMLVFLLLWTLPTLLLAGWSGRF